VRQGAVARLVAAGALRRTSPDRSVQKRWMSGGRLPEDADDFERELWTEALPLHVRNPAYSPRQSTGEYLWELRVPNGRRHMETAESRLIREGFTRPRFETAELDPATRPASEPYDPGQVRMAVALYGSAVLDRVDARIKGDWAREAVVSWGPGE